MSNFYKNMKNLTGLDKEDIIYILQAVSVCSAQDMLENNSCKIPKILKMSKTSGSTLDPFYKKYLTYALKGKSPIDKAATETYEIELKNKINKILEFNEDALK